LQPTQVLSFTNLGAGESRPGYYFYRQARRHQASSHWVQVALFLLAVAKTPETP
jgi:hypothetical protein